MHETPKLARCLSRVRFDDAAHVALIGEARVSSQYRQIRRAFLQCAANKLNAQPILILGHRAAVPFAKHARQMDGVNLHLRRDCVEGERLAVSPVEELEGTL